MMLCRQLVKKARGIAVAYKFTFSQGHGLSMDEVELLEKERVRNAGQLCDVDDENWYIPRHMQVGEAFCYETELFAFLQRIGTLQPYVFEESQLHLDKKCLLSTAVLVVLSHASSCSNNDMIDLKNKLCKHGKADLSLYLSNYFVEMYPNISSPILRQLSYPKHCLSNNAFRSLYKHLCLHELIRDTSHIDTDTRQIDRDSSEVLGGIFMVLALFDGYKTAEKFVKTFILNYYSNIDYRDLVANKYKDLEFLEEELNEHLERNGMGRAEVRLVSSDGENTHLPLYNIGIFSDEECLSIGTDHSIDTATVAACNAALCKLMFSEKRLVSDNVLHFKPSDSVLSSYDSIVSKLETLTEDMKISEMEDCKLKSEERTSIVIAEKFLVPERYTATEYAPDKSKNVEKSKNSG